MWVPANFLTFAGFLLLVLEFVVFTYYDYDFYASDISRPEYAPVPSWVWMLAANCMFWAHTLGKHSNNALKLIFVFL